MLTEMRELKDFSSVTVQSIVGLGKKKKKKIPEIYNGLLSSQSQLIYQIKLW